MNVEENTVALVNRFDTQVWLVVLTIVGLVVAFALFPEEWSAGRKVLAGVFTGVGSTFCVFMPRMIGGHDFN